MPIQGFTRYRKWQFGKQSAFGTAVAATRVMHRRGPLEINPNWTARDDIDEGSLDPIAAPYRTGLDLTAQLTGRAEFDDLPILFSGLLKGGVSPTSQGQAKTWTYQPASLSVDSFDYFTGEWGDDVAGDGAQASDGIITSAGLTWPEDLGPIEVSEGWRFGKLDRPHSLTGALTHGSNTTLVYAADTEFFLDDTPGAIGTSKLADQVHGASITIEAEPDLKRFANGSNTRFEVAGYGRGARVITVSLTLAKSTESIAETDDWLAADSVARYFEARVTSPVMIPGTSTPYSLSIRAPIRWLTRTDGEIGNNSTIVLEGQAFYDPTLGYAIRAVVVNSLSTLP